MSRSPADLAAYRESLQVASLRLGFELPEHDAFATTQTGFDKYRKACGIRHFTAREACTPHSKAKARKVGYTRFVPPQFCWPWCALVLKIGDGMRRTIGEPIRLRNMWRPYSYNRLVAKSGIDSDHPNACSADFDFKSVASRRKAEGYARGIAATMPELEMSLGLGARVIHLGVMSPKGSRVWWYDSYKEPHVGLG